MLRYGAIKNGIFRTTPGVGRPSGPLKVALRMRHVLGATAGVVPEDIRDLENVKEIGLLELLIEVLSERVGAPLSVKSLREDLQVAHETVERWLTIFERLYLCFRILPFGASKLRAVKKEQKLYFWDWSMAHERGGTRFENLVACQLLKYCHFLEDAEGEKMELHYFRDTDRREFDFVVLRNKQPVFAVECKTGESSRSPAGFYLRKRSLLRRFYQVHLGTIKQYLWSILWYIISGWLALRRIRNYRAVVTRREELRGFLGIGELNLK